MGVSQESHSLIKKNKGMNFFKHNTGIFTILYEGTTIVTND